MGNVRRQSGVVRGYEDTVLTLTNLPNVSAAVVQVLLGDIVFEHFAGADCLDAASVQFRNWEFRNHSIAPAFCLVPWVCSKLTSLISLTEILGAPVLGSAGQVIPRVREVALTPQEGQARRRRSQDQYRSSWSRRPRIYPPVAREWSVPNEPSRTHRQNQGHARR